jgi:hypothetical protein
MQVKNMTRGELVKVAEKKGLADADTYTTASLKTWLIKKLTQEKS